MKVVIDSSVAIKLVVEEEFSDEATLLLGHDLVVPDLLFAEVTNVLWKKVRRQEATESFALDALETLLDVELSVLASRTLATRAFTLSLQIQHPAYDCLYLAAAHSANANYLVTADRRFIAASQNLPASDWNGRIVGVDGLPPDLVIPAA